MSAFPPMRSRPSQPVSSAHALDLLQEYLQQAQDKTHLRPNAILTASGPTAPDASSNLTLHNLKRVEAGLKGEWLAPKLELDEQGGELKNEIPIVGDQDVEATGEEGWQDLESYQKEQVEDLGDIEDRGNAIGQEGDEAVPMEIDSTAQPIDKEARKRAKKERSKKTKTERSGKKLKGNAED